MANVRLPAWLAALAAVAALSCGRTAGDRLARCDFADDCARAVAEVRARPAGYGAAADRLAAADVELTAAAAFPAPDGAFLAGAGLAGAATREAAAADVDALLAMPSRPAAAADALDVASFLKSPTCERFDRLEDIASRGGTFAVPAALARMSALGELLGSMAADRAEAVADEARRLVGCTLSEQAGSSAVLVAARNLFYDAVEACKAAGQDAEVRESCRRAADLAKTRDLPLPLVGTSGGAVFGAWLPIGTRGLGMSFTPPWVLVLSAGRLSVVDQVVLAPGERQVRDPEATLLLDLRERHGPEHLAGALQPVFKARQPYAGVTEPLVALVVDRNETVSDLEEVLDGEFAVSDAVAALALLPSGGRAPLFYPLNWRVPTRMLLDPMGGRRPFTGEDRAVTLDLSSLAATVRSAAGRERSAALPRGESRSGLGFDLRELYAAASDFGGPASGPWPTLLVTAEPTVSVALLAGAVEMLAVRVPPGGTATADAFDGAAAGRSRAGGLDFLLPVSVLLPRSPR